MNKAEKFLLIIFIVTMEGMVLAILRDLNSSGPGAGWGLIAIIAASLFIAWPKED